MLRDSALKVEWEPSVLTAELRRTTSLVWLQRTGKDTSGLVARSTMATSAGHLVRDTMMSTGQTQEGKSSTLNKTKKKLFSISQHVEMLKSCDMNRLRFCKCFNPIYCSGEANSHEEWIKPNHTDRARGCPRKKLTQNVSFYWDTWYEVSVLLGGAESDPFPPTKKFKVWLRMVVKEAVNGVVKMFVRWNDWF